MQNNKRRMSLIDEEKEHSTHNQQPQQPQQQEQGQPQLSHSNDNDNKQENKENNDSNNNRKMLKEETKFNIESLQVIPVSFDNLRRSDFVYRSGHAGCGLRGRLLYLFGGWNGNEYLDSGLLFDIKAGTLVMGNHKILPFARKDHTLCQIGSCILLFGGFNGSHCMNDLWSLDGNWQWSQLSDNANVNTTGLYFFFNFVCFCRRLYFEFLFAFFVSTIPQQRNNKKNTHKHKQNE